MKKILLVAAALMLFSGAAMAVPLADFIPFGSGAGDATLPANDDGSTSFVPLSTSLPFYGTSYSGLYVNNNGNITFNGSMSTFTPFAFPSSVPIIAPYFADVDTRSGSGPWGANILDYSERTDAPDLALINAKVAAAGFAGFTGTDAFVATWDHVGYYFEHTDKVNTFQVQVVTDGTSSYAIFDYLDNGMSWETGDASGGSGGFGGTPAIAGFDKGNGTDYYEIPGSETAAIAPDLEGDSNVGVPGEWVFQINAGAIVPPVNGAAVPEPMTMSLLATGLVGLLVRRMRK